MATWRTDVVNLLPWVCRTTRANRCDAYRAMSERARRDPERRESYRCHAPAWWHFTAETSRVVHPAQSGTYCWSHLTSHLLRHPTECDRFHAWCRAHLGDVNDVRRRHGLSEWTVYAPDPYESMNGGK